MLSSWGSGQTYLATSTEPSQAESLNIHKSPIILQLLKYIKEDKVVSLPIALRWRLGRMQYVLVCVAAIWELLD